MPGPKSDHVAVLAPSGNDAPLIAKMLEPWAIRAEPARDMAELCERIGIGVGVVIVAQEALGDRHREVLLEALDAQPPWSDVPVVLLTGEGDLGRTMARGVAEVVRRGNVTLLERPVRVATLALAVRAALKARRRQYEMRDYLADRERLVDAERRARTSAVRLQELTAALSVASTMTEVVAATVRQATRAVGADGAVVAWITDGNEVELLGATDMHDDDQTVWRRFPLDAPVPLADVARTGESVFLSSPSDWAARYPTLAPLADSAGHQANAVIPLVVEGRSVGALGLAFAAAHEFPIEERELAVAVARQCGLAVARARLYEAEREARQEADEANRAKSEFLAVMSHELRTPLNAIAGYAELMAMGLHGPVTDEQREALRRVQKSEQHLLGLINAMLNYARIESGSVHFDIADVPVDDVFATCEALVEPQARAKGIRLDVPVCDAALALHADREKVQQILLNLLSNAIKFTGSGGTVSMSCERAKHSPDERHELTICVSDTGRGIPTDRLAEIFEPFVQVDARLTRTHEGVGLGLAISRELARAMDGELAVESEVGHGTTLTLTLPSA